MAPKRAFGGVLRPFGGGFRGPNRERASVFSGAGRGRAGGSAVEPGRDQRVQRRGTGAVQGVLRWSPEAEPACSAAQDGGGAGGSAVEPGRGQRVQRWGPVRDGGGTGGGSAAQAGAGPACSAARDRGGTGSSEVQTGRAGRREGGGGMASRPPPRPLPKAAAGCKADGRAAGSQKKCSEGKMRPPPGRKKVFRGEGAPPPEHIRAQKKRTSVRSLLFLLHYSATLRASAPGCSSDTPCRTTTAPHSGSPSLLRETSGSMFSCNSLSAFDFGLPVGRGHSRESLRHPEPQPLSRPPVGAQPPGRRNLSRPGSPP